MNLGSWGALAAAGVLGCVLAGAGEPPTPEETTQSRRYIMATGRIDQRPDAEALYVFDQDERRLVVYSLSRSELTLLHVRNCTYDFKPNEFNHPTGAQKPTVAEMKAAVK